MNRFALFLLFLIFCQPAYANVHFESFAANDTNILASQDVNTSSNSSEHQHLNVSIGVYGNAGNSGSVSADRSKGERKKGDATLFSC